MRLSAKIFYNTVIQIISKVMATVLGLVAVAVITRYLGLIGFGQYTTIITFLSVFGILADLGLTLVTAAMISRPGVDEGKILNNLFTLRLVSAIFFLALAPLTIIFLPYGPEVKLGVAVAVFSFFFIALNQIFVGLFQKNLRMDKVSIAEIIGRLVLVAGVIFAVELNLGLLGIIFATVFASAINFLFLFIFSWRFVRLRIQFDWLIWKEIIRKTWPLAITIAFNLIYLKADTLILSLIKTPGEVGVYGAAYKVIDVLITIPFMFAGIILPVLTADWAGGSMDSFKKVLQKSFDFMMILAVPLVVGTQFLAEEVMVVVAGRDFAASGAVLKILVLASWAIFFGCIFSHAIIALDKQKKIIGAYFFTSVTALAGYLIFIPRFSYLGAAWVTVYSELFIALAAFYLVYKYAGFFFNFKVLFKSILASGVMAVFLWILPNQFSGGIGGLFSTLSFSAAVYFLALYFLKGVTREEILVLLNRETKNRI
ncbi:MAG: flippase [Patescibacteria group bacterium]|nr:flippase [Patescibacteria group bacterium]MDD5554242.1 flippase [Patescibacteria group bacterium]